jgi:hypothetical protein
MIQEEFVKGFYELSLRALIFRGPLGYFGWKIKAGIIQK